MSRRRYDEAVDVFLEASKIAHAQDAADQAVWAKVSAAGVLIDSGKSKQARPLLESMSTLYLSNRFFRIHLAEVLEAEGRFSEALEIYGNLLEEQDEAEIQRRHATRLRLAEGPLQLFVASQLALLDQMAYMVVASQAGLREPALGVLIDSARRRSRMSHVLSQAVEAEHAMNRLWRLQIAVREPGDRS